VPAFGDRYRVLATELGFEGHMGMKPPPTEKTAVTIPVQCHRSSREAHGADFYSATDLLADNRRSVDLIVLW
jgi:hypothetical protein